MPFTLESFWVFSCDAVKITTEEIPQSETVTFNQCFPDKPLLLIAQVVNNVSWLVLQPANIKTKNFHRLMRLKISARARTKTLV